MLAGGALAAPVHPVTHTEWMQKKRFIEGDLGGNLALDRPVTIAEAATVLARLKGVTSWSIDASSHWASVPLSGATKFGVTADEVKSPDKPVSSARLIDIFGQAGYKLQLADASTVNRADFFQAIGDAATLHITIGHTNDVHGHIEENKSNKEFGYAKMATLIKQWRSENPNFLLMDAGDTFQGTVFVNQFKGESIVPILNYLDYNTMAAGNHEFDFGYQQLLKLRDMLEYPVINANVFKQDGTELLPPVYYAEIGGKKFAFLGFVTEETPILTHPDNVKGLTFKSPVEVAKQLVPELKKKADHVVVVSHVGIETDREIAKNVPGIDLIIGGHSHSPLRTPEQVNGTYIVQDWEYGKSLGRADLYYLGNELVNFSGGLLEYDEKVQEDPEIAKMVKSIVADIDKALNVVIAKTDVDLDGDRNFVRKRETNLGNFITDTMIERSKKIDGYAADVALTNGGGIRTQVKKGDITKKALYDVLPFPNTVVILEVKGSELKAALENGVSQVESGGGRFPQISGMSFSYNPTKPAGQRVVEVKVGGKVLDSDQTYRLATNDFVAAGGDGYAMFKDKKALNTGITLYELIEEALIARKSINPTTEGRIVEVK
ncbi:bifunctional metallophosphatase/5'-nucleotidase [Paenibacillus sedimenti]|uniref:5'-nucleotidase C-terminal domain-containing protein n=1 Tax=Paenibacillus sedimenti TaxID=2770274 RepID=A0A926QHQ3_9BACL|nr:5'-nucleotidase C-terminal domain-containing protein [Paenibacillus sedimenti]MBD0378763.1 5'-nucleotidase C-terminal domain-containing protein [Paenibacillus sedimenti]